MINFGISDYAIIPVRMEPDERSEMVTQILFGETFKVLESTPRWCFIKTYFDDYEGWINANCVYGLSEEEFDQINNSTTYVTTKLTSEIVDNKGQITNIPLGSSLPNINNINNNFNIGNKDYKINNQNKSTEVDIVSLCKSFLNTPYLWGGRNPYGIDCSGFVQVIFKALGNKLPRDAKQQVTHGILVNFISEAEPGDLAFFDDSEGNIIHVGIIINKKEIIHASTKVRIDKIDQQGIFNEELKRYTHKLRIIKRII